MSNELSEIAQSSNRHKFSDEEVAAMLKRGACMCGIEDAERYSNNHRRTVVPTSPNCEVHRDAY